MGHAGAKRDRRDADAVEVFVECAHDTGGSLVSRPVEPHEFGQRRIGGGSGDRRRARVRCLGDHCAQGEDELDVEAADYVDDGFDEGAPLEMRFDPVHQDEISIAIIEREGVDVVVRPFDLALAALAEAHVGPSLVEVEELVGVDPPDLCGPIAAKGLDRAGGGPADVKKPVLCSHENRLPERSCRFVFPDQLVHPTSMPAIRLVAHLRAGFTAGTKLPMSNWWHPS